MDNAELLELVAYLQGANVLKLTSAARLSGLSFKNGTPGYDKAGIIEKLSRSPAILRACVATLKRQEVGTFAPAKPNPFAESLSDPDEVKAPADPAGVGISPSPMSDALLNGLMRRLDALEGYAIGKDQADAISRQNDAPYARALSDLSARVNTRLEALEARTPVQINIGPVSLPPITGQHERFPRMAKWLNIRVTEGETVKARTHVLLIGPAGTGKTTAAVAFAQMMGLDLYAQPLCMDYTGVTGFITATGEVIETEFTRAWKNGGVLLWDELSMSAPDAVGALNSALANGFISLPGIGNVKAHKDFYFIAGDNSDTGASVLFNARTLLDGATLDRFVRIDWPVDLSLESTLANGQTSWLSCVRAIRAFISQRDIQHVGATSRAVIQGSQALAAGCFTRIEILEDTCKKGALASEWPRVLDLPAVQSFIRGY